MAATEHQFQSAVIDLAKAAGWMVFHPVPAQIRPGRWATNQSGHVGFPDLVLAHPRRGLIFAELKTDKGKTSMAQDDWLNTLELAGAEAYCWRPADWPDITTRLTGLTP
jgi:hypothetical protein